MLVVMVTARVKPGKRDEFLKVIKEDAESTTTKEEGNFGFYVVQENEDPDKFFLFEIYRDQAALEAHRQTPHFLKYREAVADIYEGDPVRVMGTNIWPSDAVLAQRK